MRLSGRHANVWAKRSQDESMRMSVRKHGIVNNIPTVKIFVIFGEYFLIFPYVYIKNVLYKSCEEFSAKYDKK